MTTETQITAAAALLTASAIDHHSPETPDGREQRRLLSDLTKRLHRHHLGHVQARLTDAGNVALVLKPYQLLDLVEALS